MFIKKIIFVICAMLGLFIIINCFDSDYHIIIKNNNFEEKVIEDSLAMMYETVAGSGEYQVASDNSWPQEQYAFNERLSKCEHGSKIYYNDNTKRIMVEANTMEKCYVYFDVKDSIVDTLNTVAVLTNDMKVLFNFEDLSLDTKKEIKEIYLKVSFQDAIFEYHFPYNSNLNCGSLGCSANYFVDYNEVYVFGTIFNYELYTINSLNQKSFVFYGVGKVVGEQHSGGTDK